MVRAPFVFYLTFFCKTLWLSVWHLDWVANCLKLCGCQITPEISNKIFFRNLRRWRRNSCNDKGADWYKDKVVKRNREHQKNINAPNDLGLETKAAFGDADFFASSLRMFIIIFLAVNCIFSIKNTELLDLL